MAPNVRSPVMTTPRTIPARFDDSAPGGERALYTFLAEKERRSGSMRTVQSYSRMLQDFFGRLGKPSVAGTWEQRRWTGRGLHSSSACSTTATHFRSCEHC